MKSLALAGPFMIWLVLAVPLNCHHGLTTPWAAAGHVHQAGSLDGPFQVVPGPAAAAGTSGPALCQHQVTSSEAPMAYAALDYSLDSAPSRAAPEHSRGRLTYSSLLEPQGVSPSPPERPPSYPT